MVWFDTNERALLPAKDLLRDDWLIEESLFLSPEKQMEMELTEEKKDGVEIHGYDSLLSKIIAKGLSGSPSVMEVD